ncbi:hypothetical protein L7F22_023318 [Adiantum nelumboides]|nr:hypothetical protein [Adiantum nelumboides]
MQGLPFTSPLIFARPRSSGPSFLRMGSQMGCTAMGLMAGVWTVLSPPYRPGSFSSARDFSVAENCLHLAGCSSVLDSAGRIRMAGPASPERCMAHLPWPSLSKKVRPLFLIGRHAVVCWRQVEYLSSTYGIYWIFGKSLILGGDVGCSGKELSFWWPPRLLRFGLI